MRRLWDDYWHRREPPSNLAAARVLLAATALWVIVSRHDLPAVLTVPAEVLERLSFERRLRFFMVFGVDFERVLFGVLHVTLLMALAGWRTRLACFASGLLLYHFAPFETIVRSGNPYLRGLTIPALGLLICSFSPSGAVLALDARGRAAPASASEYRWPLALIQVLFAQIYLFAFYSKLFASGLLWAAASNVRAYLLLINQALGTPGDAVAFAVARSAFLCAGIAWAGLVFELLFPMVLFVPKTRWVLLPAALFFHVANSVLFRIFFHNVFLLGLFIDWDAGWRSWRRWRGGP